MESEKRRKIMLPMAEQVDRERITGLIAGEVNAYRRENGLPALLLLKRIRREGETGKGCPGVIRLAAVLDAETFEKYRNFGEITASFEECMAYDALERICDGGMEELLLDGRWDSMTVSLRTDSDSLGRIAGYAAALSMYCGKGRSYE